MNIEQLLRHMLAPGPGNAIVHGDKKQLEIRVMAVVAADEVLQTAIDSGDLYSAEARGYFNIPDSEPVKKSARQSAKIIRLARQYGAGLKTCYAQGLRMDRTFTLSRTQLLMGQFDRRYYRTVRYWQEEMQRVGEAGYSESRLLGRRRSYPMPPELSETVNYPIQATAADMMNMEILTLDDRLRKDCPSAQIIIQLHDAVDVECPEKDVPKVERIMDEVMHREWTFCGVTRMFGIDRKATYHSQGGTWADV
jgi:DNA polymerase-1